MNVCIVHIIRLLYDAELIQWEKVQFSGWLALDKVCNLGLDVSYIHKANPLLKCCFYHRTLGASLSILSQVEACFRFCFFVCFFFFPQIKDNELRWFIWLLPYVSHAGVRKHPSPYDTASAADCWNRNLNTIYWSVTEKDILMFLHM